MSFQISFLSTLSLRGLCNFLCESSEWSIDTVLASGTQICRSDEPQIVHLHSARRKMLPPLPSHTLPPLLLRWVFHLRPLFDPPFPRLNHLLDLPRHSSDTPVKHRTYKLQGNHDIPDFSVAACSRRTFISLQRAVGVVVYAGT